MEPLYRAYDATIDSVNKTERSLVAKINTAGIDRFRTVIEPKGAKLDNYRKNPVVLWEHGKDVHRRFTDPIGTNQWITERSGELLAKTRFLDDEFSQQRYEWYRDGVLSAFSIHALPSEGSPPTKEELRSRPELKDCSFVYRAWELAEYSGTAVPGNADTLTTERAGLLLRAVERGLWLPDDIKPIIEAKAIMGMSSRAAMAALGGIPECPTGRTFTDSQGGLAGGGGTVKPAEGQERFIKKKGDKWVVHSESGKELGEHGDEESAKKQLAAIEAHKHDKRAWIDHQGEVFIVRSFDGSSILSTKDQVIAEECLEAMTKRSTFESLHHELMQTVRSFAAESRRDQQEFRNELTAYLDLMVHGKV